MSETMTIKRLRGATIFKLIVIGSAINKFADSDYASISRFNSETEKKQFEESDKKKEEETKEGSQASWNCGESEEKNAERKTEC